MKFEKDVFISYAHLDDKPLDASSQGWVADFHRLLQTRLEQTVGHEVAVWRDEKLTGNEIFAPEIVSQLPKLKVMVSIITPRYVQSGWCKDELSYFYKAASENGGLAVGNKSRIFKIVKTPVDQDTIEQLPGELHRVFDEILDYKFYRIDAGTGRFKELGLYWGDDDIRKEYVNKVDDVAQDIANLIKKLKDDAVLPDVPQRKIFLAETSYDLLEYRDSLVRELKDAGFTVLPNRNLPYVIDRFAEEVEACLTDCILSLHLVSATNYAVQPEGSDKSIVVLQNEMAAQKSAASNLQRLIWIPPPTSNASNNEKMLAQQKAYVDQLKVDGALQQGADILEGPLEKFKEAIFDTIKRMEDEQKAKREANERAEKLAASAAANPSATTAAEPKLVYLLCDQRDLDTTRPLEDLLYDSGHEVLLPFFDGDQGQLREVHLENLKLCDAVIIYYGAANIRWTQSIRSDLARLPAYGRTKPLLGKIIYIAAPADSDKNDFKANGYDVINGLSGFANSLFHPFLQKLK